MKKNYIKNIQKNPVMTNREKFIYTILFAVGIGLVFDFALWWFSSSHIPSNFRGFSHIFDYILFITLSYVVWYQITNEVFAWVTALKMKKPAYLPPQSGHKVAFLTAFVPGSEPYSILEKTLQAIKDVKYPHDTWVLDEGNDPYVKELCNQLGVFHFSRKGSRRYNTQSGQYKAKTKAGNYNSWYNQYQNDYEFVAQVDVDFIPNKNFLTKTLGYFSDPFVAFVGSPQVYGNTKESWIANGAAQQAYGFYGTLQKGLFGDDMQLFIGANHIVRTAAHSDIEGYSGHIVEDHLTGMKIYANKWRSVYVPEVLAIGEGPATWGSYLGQQMRWSYGLIDILFSHSPKIFKRMRFSHIINYFLLQQYYFYGFAQVLGVLLISFYFILNLSATRMGLLPLIVFYLPLLLWQQVIYFWLQRFYIRPNKESGFHIYGKILSWAAWPVYFLAFIGVLFKKRIVYKVTPKGIRQKFEPELFPFLPHFLLGTVTLVDIIASVLLKHGSPQLLFWASVNTFVMYSFFFKALVGNLSMRLKAFKFPKVASIISRA